MKNRLLHWAFSLTLLLLSCSYQTLEPTSPREPLPDINFGQSLYFYNIGVGQERELKLAVDHLNTEGLDLLWHADGGSIESQDGPSVVFRAPDYAGKITVTCHVKSGNKVVSVHTFAVTAYTQVVVLKADDLVYVSGTVFPSNWNKYFDLLDSLHIKGTAGIIGNSLENAPQAYYDKIKNHHKKGLIEFWNHGYTHEIGGRNAKGEVYHEFFNRDLQAQEKNIKRTQDLGREKLGITFRAFGAPGNNIDHITKEIIDGHKDIRIWFYGDENSPKNILRRTAGCEIEFPVHHPSYSRFKENYKIDARFLTLQFHPTRWSPQQFGEFRQILTFLKNSHVAFMNPTEFAATFYPELIHDLQEINTIL